MQVEKTHEEMIDYIISTVREKINKIRDETPDPFCCKKCGEYKTDNTDFVLCEIGGTVGDIEGLPYLEEML